MRTLILICFTQLFLHTANAQLIKRKVEEAKTKTTQRADSRSSEGIDKALDKAEEKIGNIFKKKTKNGAADTIGNGGYDAPVTMTDEQGNTDYTSYKDFDFIPGEHILFFEDFADGSTARWGAYDANNLSVTTQQDKQWMQVRGGSFFPLGLKTLPQNFTLEFDVYTADKHTGTVGVRFIDKSQAAALADPWMDNSSEINMSPITQMPKTGLGNYVKKINNEERNPQNEFKFYSWQPERENFFARISISRKGNMVSAWINKEQVLKDVDLFAAGIEYVLAFHLQTYFVDENKMAFTNFRLATGAAQPKTEMVTKKKFVTQNIYFDVNSDVIRPNSYSILKEIAEGIQNVTGTVSIIGHTDNDGKDTDNLVLSQKRAASVKRALVNEFGIPAEKLTTDGKGESQPLNKNSNPAEKAQNRRVEFIIQ